MKKVIGLFPQQTAAEDACNALESAGFSPRSIAQFHRAEALWRQLGCTPGHLILKDFAIGAVLGIALFGWFGVIVTIATGTIGIGTPPALGAGLIFALVGLLIGGMLGLTFGFGDAEQESRVYLRGIRQGGVIVVVETADEHAARALHLLQQANGEGVQICARGAIERAQQRLVHRPESRFTRSLQWAARLLGMAMLLVVAAFFVGEGFAGEAMPDLRTMSLGEDALLVALLVTLVGIVVAWRWEVVGALLIIGSTVLFALVNAIAGGYWRFGPLEPFFYFVGLLFLWHWWQTTGSHRGAATET